MLRWAGGGSELLLGRFQEVIDILLQLIFAELGKKLDRSGRVKFANAFDKFELIHEGAPILLGHILLSAGKTEKHSRSYRMFDNHGAGRRPAGKISQ